MAASKTVAGRTPSKIASEPALLVREEPGGTVPVIEEVVRIDKRVVEKGGYRITKRVASHHETVDELLSDHQVTIERRPMGLTLQGTDVPQQRYEGDVLIIPVIEEILFTEKRLVLVEEVRVTRIQGTHRKPQKVKLRKEEISIERLEAGASSAPEPSQPPTPQRQGNNAPVGHDRSR
ncbi:MAG: YsnF/AvaK domain-containing protein [Pseudomonadota bacterium]|nr:YsnF/AvaK domain-containing protein [Pseudomonadota bacterium]